MRARQMAHMRSCDRILSGARPVTMRERLTELSLTDYADEFPDFYGDGPVGELEDRLAELFGVEAAVFFPTGVMAQQVALRYGADRTGCRTVALHPLCHLEVHERQAHQQLTGLNGVWPTTEPRNATAAEIEALGEPVGTVLFELPMRDAGFVLPTWEELFQPAPTWCA